MIYREKSPVIEVARAHFAFHDLAFASARRHGRIVDKLDTTHPHVMVATPQGMIRAKPDEYIVLSEDGSLHVLNDEQLHAKYTRIR